MAGKTPALYPELEDMILRSPDEFVDYLKRQPLSVAFAMAKSACSKYETFEALAYCDAFNDWTTSNKAALAKWLKQNYR